MRTTLRLRIRSYRSNCPDATGFQIELEDRDAGLHLFCADITAEDVANLLVGNRAIEFEADFRGADKIGTILENKTELVECDFSVGGRQSEILEPYEVDGWKARSGDLGNYHRRQPTGYCVVFFRNVPKKEEATA